MFPVLYPSLLDKPADDATRIEINLSNYDMYFSISRLALNYWPAYL